MIKVSRSAKTFGKTRYTEEEDRESFRHLSTTRYFFEIFDLPILLKKSDSSPPFFLNQFTCKKEINRVKGEGCFRFAFRAPTILLLHENRFGRASSMHHRFSLARRRFAAVVFGGASPPRGVVGGGVRDWMSVGKKTHAIGTKNVFLFLFAKKKPQKKRAKERYFTTQTTSFQHRTPKRDAPRTKIPPPPGRNGNGRRRSENSFENPSLDRRGTTSDDPRRRRLAPFFW